MLERKWYTGSVKGFLKEIKAMSENDASTSLVGVHYTNDILTSAILTDVYLEVLPDKDTDTLIVGVEMIPSVLEREELDNFNALLEDTGVGKLYSMHDRKDDTELKSMARFFLQNTALSDVQKYELMAPFHQPVVEHCSYKLNGTTYKQYKISGSATTPAFAKEGLGGILGQTLYVLVKDKESTHENFFSALVGESLMKQDAIKVLEVISTPNVTGLNIGGFDVLTVKSGFRTTSLGTYGIQMTNLDTEENGLVFMVRHGDAITVIETEHIKGMDVVREGDMKYRLSLVMRDNDTTIHIHLG